MFYLTTHSTHFRLYGVRHMVKDHSDSEKGNPLLPHGLLFPISSKGSFYMHHPTDRITHTTAFVTPVVPVLFWLFANTNIFLNTGCLPLTYLVLQNNIITGLKITHVVVLVTYE